MKNTLVAILAMAPVPSVFAQAAPAAPDAKAGVAAEGFTVKPVILDSKGGGGATLAVQYKLQRSGKKNFDGSDVGSDTFDPNARLADLSWELRGEGTIATDKERNPHKLIDLAAHGYYNLSTSLATFGVGGMLKYETDQGFDNKQYVWGLSALAYKYEGFLPRNSHGSIRVGYGRVEPKSDAARKTVLGTTPLSAFNRWNLEAYYNYPLSGRLTSIEFQYRHFQEVDPLAVVAAAGIDRHRLGTIRFNIKDDLFLAYSKGSLPFDRKSDRAVTLGWSYKLD